MVNKSKVAARAANLPEMLACVRGLAAQAGVQFSGAVLPVMSKRALSVHDVMHALEHATSCLITGDDVHVAGPTIDDEPLQVVIRVSDIVYVLQIL